MVDSREGYAVHLHYFMAHQCAGLEMVGLDVWWQFCPGDLLLALWLMCLLFIVHYYLPNSLSG